MNYGSFSERVKHLFSLKMIFKILKLSSFSFLIYLLLTKSTNIHGLNKDFLFNNIFKFQSDKYYIYILPVIIYSLFMILSNSLNILEQFSLDKFNKSRSIQFISFLTFILYRIIAFCYTYIIFAFIFYILNNLDNEFTTRNLRIFDWYYLSENLNHNYNSGVYFSLILTLTIFFLFNNAFLKINSNFFNYRTTEISFFAYFFITIIICIGVFFGLFSIFNAIYNIRATSLTEWFNKENIIGLLPIRLASVMILVNLFKYIYNETLEKKIFPFFILALFPVRHIENYNLTIKIETRETLYFSQIAFYILNIAIAEYFVIIEFKIVYLSILNFAILFIQDDFNIINEYSKGMQTILPNHFRRIQLFNIIMLVSAILALILTKSFGVLTIYSILSLILILLYRYNYSFINSQDYKF
ncbi:hypothetical protein [Chryseobacterium indoltheticum]|uniref:hypothetical protein n=1 Tax=Chryseobacterium indoltheticum TaxID=254 RepID=UPI0040438AC4